MKKIYEDENAGDYSWRWVKPLDESFVVVCGIVRDAERGLKANIPVVRSFCNCCKDWRVVVFENDSKDRTKEILRKYMISDEKRGGGANFGNLYGYGWKPDDSLCGRGEGQSVLLKAAH